MSDRQHALRRAPPVAPFPFVVSVRRFGSLFRLVVSMRRMQASFRGVV